LMGIQRVRAWGAVDNRSGGVLHSGIDVNHNNWNRDAQ
jgi:hypothetical protein